MKKEKIIKCIFLFLLHGFHEKGFYYRPKDFFLMSFRDLSFRVMYMSYCYTCKDNLYAPRPCKEALNKYGAQDQHWNISSK